MGGQKSNEHKPVGSEQTTRRALGKQTPGQLAATKLRILGDDKAKKPVLDVAAFNSFIG